MKTNKENREGIFVKRVIDDKNLLSGKELYEEAVKLLDDYFDKYTGEEREEHGKDYRKAIRDNYIENGSDIPSYLK